MSDDGFAILCSYCGENPAKAMHWNGAPICSHCELWAGVTFPLPGPEPSQSG